MLSPASDRGSQARVRAMLGAKSFWQGEAPSDAGEKAWPDRSRRPPRITTERASDLEARHSPVPN